MTAAKTASKPTKTSTSSKASPKAASKAAPRPPKAAALESPSPRVVGADLPESVAARGGPPGEVMQAAAVQAVAVALLNAAQHVQRTSVVTEAAVAGSLAKALASGGPPEDWIQVLDASTRALDAAMASFRQTVQLAAGLTAPPAD